MSLIKPPLQILLIRPTLELQLSSIDEPTFLDITQCEYADLVLFADIIDAPKVSDRVKLLHSTRILDEARRRCQDDSIGVLKLRLFEDTLLLVVDDEREVNVEEVVTHLRKT